MLRCRNIRPPGHRALILALTAGVIGIVGSAEAALAQEHPSLDFRTWFSGEERVPVFAQSEFQFGEL